MRSRWSILAVLFFVRAIMAFQFQSVAALAAPIGVRYDAGLADIGLLIGLYFAPGVALALPGGALAARLGERRVVVAALALMLLGGAMMWATAGWGGMVAGRIVAAAGGVAVNVLLTKLLADWFAGREISTAMAIYVNSWPVGIALALLTLPAVAEAGGLAAAWAVVLAAIVAGLALFLAGYRPPPESAAPAGSLPQARRIPWAPLLAAGWIWAFYNAAIGMVFSFGPLMLAARGWTFAAAGSATSLFLIAMALAVPAGGLLADRLQRPNAVTALGLAGFAILLPAAVWLPAAAAAAVFAVMGAVSGLAAGPVMGMPARVLPPETRAFGMGVFFTIYYAVFMAAPPVAGALADRAGEPAAPFLLGAAMAASCLAALAVYRRAAAAGP